MEPCRFCEESFVDIEDLEAALTNQIEQFRQEVPEKQLVLVGLSLQSDFERLSLEFPRIIGLFSAWIDLSTLIKAESPTPTKLHTGLGTALKTFRYPFVDTGFADYRHQAANDAVRTLAALSGLTDPENVASLVLRQHQFAGIEVNSTTKRFESKVYRALLHVNGRDLPQLIDSAQKLAFAVQSFNPIGVAADCSNATNKREMHYRSSIHTPGRTCGCVCFKSNRALQAFISATNGWKYGEVVLKVVRAPLPERIWTQIEKGKGLKMKRKTARFETARAPDINWANTFRDIFSIEDEHKEDITVLEDNSTTITLDYKGEDVGERQQPSRFSKILRKIIHVY
ncbi:hypothetical protein E0Z10_g3627 [Xylaria hypoxylon]|uniref:Uncharacterized protein n=1 Tax=Xylaria hypoxylon TaxID=37992 RepID=A0A4Z0Z198_9PEZI|nr:hypothetical protein E0Z10_g3627 [Xylaria hypoxylon]